VSSIKLIVGLGNPGAEYEHTRHNAGAWFLHEIAQTHHITLRLEKKFGGFYGSGKIADQDCHLLIPNTYMNCSGLPVTAAAKFFKIPPENILIAHDEIDLPCADLRLKTGGGAGGHNGLKDIIAHLNTQQFHRLRVGIARPPGQQDVADYVLSRASKTEMTQIFSAFTKALDALPFLVRGEMQKAMHFLHTNT
jgi:PTH1 family peptidyl-tRNA hydrolase